MTIALRWSKTVSNWNYSTFNRTRVTSDKINIRNTSELIYDYKDIQDIYSNQEAIHNSMRTLPSYFRTPWPSTHSNLIKGLCYLEILEKFSIKERTEIDFNFNNINAKSKAFILLETFVDAI